MATFISFLTLAKGAPSRRFSLAWLLVFTKSFARLVCRVDDLFTPREKRFIKSHVSPGACKANQLRRCNRETSARKAISCHKLPEITIPIIVIKKNTFGSRNALLLR